MNTAKQEGPIITEQTIKELLGKYGKVSTNNITTRTGTYWLEANRMLEAADILADPFHIVPKTHTCAETRIVGFDTLDELIGIGELARYRDEMEEGSQAVFIFGYLFDAQNYNANQVGEFKKRYLLYYASCVNWLKDK